MRLRQVYVNFIHATEASHGLPLILLMPLVAQTKLAR